MNPDDWLQVIEKDPTHCQITHSIFPNDNGVIDLSEIDLFVSMLIRLMTRIPSRLGEKLVGKRNNIPLTPQQRAKQAERRTIIGHMGELFAMRFEETNLAAFGISREGFPDHVALRSSSIGFDILSLSRSNEEVYIEVKTTTRLMDDPEANKFYISYREYEFYKNNKDKFRLYRVYDVEGDPVLREVNMAEANVVADTYKVVFRK